MSSRRIKRRRVDKGTGPVDEERHSGSSSPVYDLHEADKAANDPESAEEAPTEGIDCGVFAKEVEIWDAFREEQNEILEQLPLSLHRVFKLINELDSQTQVRISNVIPAILKYVSLRRALADVNKEQEEGHAQPQTSDSSGMGKLSTGSSLSPPPTSTPGPTSTRGRTTPVPPASLAAIVESSNSTRELLINIAQSAEEISRASNEKYHLARHVYDLIDRYIHDLDRAIKEQEASISLGLRPGTHPASIILPELVIPKANRSRVVASPPPIEISIEPIVPSEPVAQPQGEERPVPAPKEGEEEVEVVERSPSPEDDVKLVEIVEDPDSLAVQAVESTSTRRKRKGRKTRQSARARTEPAPVEHEDLASEESMGPELEGEEPEVEHQPSLRLKIPAQNVGPPLSEGEVPDPNEPRYCFCNQVSYGEMIACDNPTCTREWFHMGCVGVTKTPKGKWYCRECIDLVKRSKGRKRQR